MSETYTKPDIGTETYPTWQPIPTPLSDNQQMINVLNSINWNLMQIIQLLKDIKENIK